MNKKWLYFLAFLLITSITIATSSATGWTKLTSSTGWSARAYQSSVVLPDGSIVLMGGWYKSGEYNDVWKSVDGGATWTELTASAEWSPRSHHSSVVLPDGSILLMGGWYGSGQSNDVWKSTDGGAHWTLVTKSAEWKGRENFVSVVLPDGSIVLMGGYSGGSGFSNDVWKSIDGGKTWTLVTASAEWSPRLGHSALVLPDGSIVLTGGLDHSRSTNDVWKSTDGGATWRKLTGSPGWSPRYFHSSVLAPDGSIVLLGGTDRSSVFSDIWKSTDGGTIWTIVTKSAEWSPRAAVSNVVLPDGSNIIIGGVDNPDSPSVMFKEVWKKDPTFPSATHTQIAGGVKIGGDIASNTVSPSTTHTQIAGGVKTGGDIASNNSLVIILITLILLCGGVGFGVYRLKGRSLGEHASLTIEPLSSTPPSSNSSNEIKDLQELQVQYVAFEKTREDQSNREQLFQKATTLRNTVTSPTLLDLYRKEKYEEFVYKVQETQELLSRWNEALDKAKKIASVPNTIISLSSNPDPESLSQAFQALGDFLKNARPVLETSLGTTQFTAGKWYQISVPLFNSGNAHAFNVIFSFSEEFETKRIKPTQVGAGKIISVDIGLMPKNSGRIPFEITFHYSDGNTREYTETHEFWIDVLDPIAGVQVSDRSEVRESPSKPDTDMRSSSPSVTRSLDTDTHHDVFITYSHKDKPVADAVCATLENKGFRCWIAPRDVLPGENFPDAIINAINFSKIMVLIFSSHSNSSPHVIRELTKAVSKGVIIIPFRIEDAPLSKSMEYLIGLPHWLDALTPPLENHIERLAKTVGAILNRRE